MKDLSDSSEILKRLKHINNNAGVEALNYMLTQHKYVSNSRRHYYLQYFVQENITSVIIVDKVKLKEFEDIRKVRRGEKEAVPHSRNTEDFLDILIKTMQASKKDSFFCFVGNQLLLIADRSFSKQVEKVLGQMGLKIIYFRGLLK